MIQLYVIYALLIIIAVETASHRAMTHQHPTHTRTGQRDSFWSNTVFASAGSEFSQTAGHAVYAKQIITARATARPVIR